MPPSFVLIRPPSIKDIIIMVLNADISTLIAVILFLLILVWAYRTSTPASTPLPPGPKPIPILGNLRDFTAKEFWVTSANWAKKYGDVCRVHIFGKSLIFLSSPEAALDLLDKRGSIYSDKLHLVMTSDLVGAGRMTVFTGYGETLKRQRRLMHHALGPQSIRSYDPRVETETKALLHRLLVDPEDYLSSLRRYTGGLSLQVLYGYEAHSNQDELLALASETIDILANRVVSSIGIWPVDVIPALRHIPHWFPGAGFKRNAIEWKAKLEEFVNRPYDFTKNNMKECDSTPSFCSTLLEDSAAVNEQTETDIKWVANSMYAGSIDSTVTLLSHFLLMMMEHPEVLAKAQLEIDSVVGNDRLPTYEDRPSLPYIECILSESLRWAAPIPLNLPHRLMENDVYRGMFMPKGSVIIANIWAITRDESLYPDPHVFRPERFMVPVDKEAERRRDPRSYVFGYGRRRCPGALLVDSTIWLLMASMLATMNITKPVDKAGNVIEPKVEYHDSIFRKPTAFKCSIKPRSEKAAALIRQQQ